MKRATLIRDAGRHWSVFVVEYREGELPCVDCGAATITRALGNDDEPLCGNCACWRLGAMEGKREAREHIKAETRKAAEIAALLASEKAADVVKAIDLEGSL